MATCGWEVQETHLHRLDEQAPQSKVRPDIYRMCELTNSLSDAEHDPALSISLQLVCWQPQKPALLCNLLKGVKPPHRQHRYTQRHESVDNM